MAEGGSTCAREGAAGHLEDVLGLEPPRVLELARPDPQALLALPLERLVVYHEVDVGDGHIVLLGGGGGEPGEGPPAAALWLGGVTGVEVQGG